MRRDGVALGRYKGAKITIREECGILPEEFGKLADVCYDNGNIGAAPSKR